MYLCLHFSPHKIGQHIAIWIFPTKMKRKSCIILVVTLLCWVSVTSRPFASYDAPHQQANQTEKNPYSQGATIFDSKQGVEEGLGGGRYRELSRLGSRPPNCEHICGSCEPCVPVQTPITTDHFGVQYTNYEPEGWRCKCGSTLFTP